jgi:hypothetical protein
MNPLGRCGMMKWNYNIYLFMLFLIMVVSLVNCSKYGSNKATLQAISIYKPSLIDANSETWVVITDIIAIKENGEEHIAFHNTVGQAYNLAELDQMADIIGFHDLPDGTYTKFYVTMKSEALITRPDPMDAHKQLMTMAKFNSFDAPFAVEVNGDIRIMANKVTRKKMDFINSGFKYILG